MGVHGILPLQVSPVMESHSASQWRGRGFSGSRLQRCLAGPLVPVASAHRAFRCGRVCCHCATVSAPSDPSAAAAVVIGSQTPLVTSLSARGCKGTWRIRSPRPFLWASVCSLPCQQLLWLMGDASSPWEEGEWIFLPRLALANNSLEKYMKVSPWLYSEQPGTA